MRILATRIYEVIQDKMAKLFSNAFKNLSETKSYHNQSDFSWFLLLGFLILVITKIVYLTGGTNSYVHLLYLPMILGVFIVGTRLAIALALVAGLLVGPYMPFNVAEGIMQQPHTWILRLAMFVIVVSIVGKLVDYIKKINDLEKNKAYEDAFTGFPNFNKWKRDISSVVEKNGDGNLNLIIFEFENMETINRYIGYETGRKSLIELLNLAKIHFDRDKVYAISPNKIFVSAINKNEQYMIERAKDYLDLSKTPFTIDQIPVAVILKAGFVNDKISNDIKITYRNLEKALELACHSQTDFICFNNKIAEDSAEYYATLVAIYRAVTENTFYMVYQPKTAAQSNEFSGVEALLRWDDPKYSNLSIAKVIQIAEDAGFISYITKWVIRNVISQQKTWQSQGYFLKTAINLSARDLNDSSIVNYIQKCLLEFDIEPQYLEIELTERSIIEDEKNVFSILSKLRKIGIKVSLDDYGTGHNSLMYLVKIIFGFDYLKIDKVFIDEIEKENTKTLIEGIIKSAHGQGVEIIAEGVETKEQRDILINMNCDMIQGYLYSKPLKPEALIEYINQENSNEEIEEAI